MKHEMLEKKYSHDMANLIWNCVIAHCIVDRMLNVGRNVLRKEFSDYAEAYDDVK